MAGKGLITFCLVALTALPLAAQTSADKVQQLEKKLNELTAQVQQIRQELDQLKGGGATASAPPPAASTGSEDLSAVTIINNPAPPPASTVASAPGASQPQSALTDVQTVNNPSNPGLSKVFNPDISAIGNFIGKAGQRNPYEFGSDRASLRQTMRLDEAEVGLQAFVDPYAKANFFLSATPDGLSVEEGYVQFITLPYDLTAKAGKFKAFFGKANTWHTHVRPWIDQPLVIHNLFTDDQLADDGVSVSKVFPAVTSVYLEATGEVFRGEVPHVFTNRSQNNLFYNAHLKSFKDLTENTNVEAGVSYARGTLSTDYGSIGGHNQFAGVDVTYRWKPLQQGLYRSFIGRFEGIANHREHLGRRLYGFYLSGDYQLAQRWFTGVRFDRADRAHPFDFSPVTDAVYDTTYHATDRGASATLTFWPSEFSQLRGQLRRISYGGARSVNELLFQLQFSIGAHGAHTF